MPILVSDTSILIDLERCNLIRHAFTLNAELVVPDLLYERELRPYNGADLLALGLRVEALTADEVTAAQLFRNRTRAITIADSFALVLAQARAWTLMTGDGILRDLALAAGVDCHGLLWLLDQMEQGSAATVAELEDGLRRLAGHTRCRLPKREVTIKLGHYAAMLAERLP